MVEFYVTVVRFGFMKLEEIPPVYYDIVKSRLRELKDERTVE